MSKVLVLFQNLINWIDNPKSFLKFFQILFYYLPAILLPIIFIILVIDNENYIALVYFIPLIIFIVCVFIIRAKELVKEINANQKFFIIPALGHYLKTSFEIYAIMILLFPLSIVTLIFSDYVYLGFEVPIIYELFDAIGVGRGSNILSFLLMSSITTLYGYFVLFVGKFLYESFIAIAYIANNIKK